MSTRALNVGRFTIYREEDAPPARTEPRRHGRLTVTIGEYIAWKFQSEWGGLADRIGAAR